MTMRLKYPDLICESDAELAALERQLAGQRTAVRVRMLRLLKSGEAPSLRTCAAMLGRSLSQVTRWWRQYQQHGLEGLPATKPHLGKRPWVSDEVWTALQAELDAGRIKHLEGARQYLKEQWGIEYRGTSGVWALFKQRGVKLQTGPHRRWYIAGNAQTAGTPAPQSDSTPDKA
jgi:transposase